MNLSQLSIYTLGAVIGSGAGTTLVGILFKQKFDRELELQKAHLTRITRVHESAVDTLTKLYRHIYEAEQYLRLMTAVARFEAERPEEYPGKFIEAVTSARDELSADRLLIPADIGQQFDILFEAIFKGQSTLAFAQDPSIPDGPQRKQLWDDAIAIATLQIPKLRTDIEKSARKVIHGGET